MTHVSGNHIGRFMVAIGAIIESAKTGNILLIKREDVFQKGNWEIVYGRIDQFEDLDEGLAREVQEEVGLKNLTIKRLTRVWHIYRGEKNADKEIYGFTFHCISDTEEVTLSDEHSAYQWIDATAALELIKVPGIKKDLEFFINERNGTKLAISDPEGINTHIFN